MVCGMRVPQTAGTETRPSPVAAISQLVALADGPLFLEALADLLQSETGYDSTLMTVLFPSGPPLEVFDNLGAPLRSDLIKAYFSGAYLLDPFYAVFSEQNTDWVGTLEICAPDDFRSSDYYQTFYHDTGLFDECGVVLRLANEAALLISLGSRNHAFRARPEAIRFVQDLLPLISTLCRRKWPAPTREKLSAKPVIGRQIARAVEAFGTSVLSTREAETLQLLLRGHSTKSIARRLGNSPDTVKVHRKRIYAKLDVTTQGELFAKFLSVLSASPSTFFGDPLQYAMQHAARPSEDAGLSAP